MNGFVLIFIIILLLVVDIIGTIQNRLMIRENRKLGLENRDRSRGNKFKLKSK